jgi:hypothetical protein
MKKVKYFGVILFFFLLPNIKAQTCLPSWISFTNQEQINNFRGNYPDCEVIEGGVYIEENHSMSGDKYNKSIAVKLTVIDGC